MAIKSSRKRIMGCKNVHFALLTKDETGETTYGTPIFVKGIESFQYTPQKAEGEAYSDDKPDTKISIPIAYDLTLTMAEYLPKIQNMLEGSSIENGGITINTEDSQNAIAILFEYSYSDGDRGFGIFYNCKLSNEGVTHNTKTGSIEFGKIQLKGKAIPLMSGDIARFITKNEEKLKPDVIQKFYEKVLLPNEKIITD